MTKSMDVLAIAALSAVLSAADVPLHARLVAGEHPGVELRNTGDQAVTAWSFAVISRSAGGSEHREVHSADVYLSEVTRGLPRSADHLDWLRPGGSRVIAVDTAAADATVDVVAVVLENGAAIGDAAVIKAFFDQRAFERDELGRVVAVFDSVLKDQHGATALASLQARFSAADAVGADESVPHRTAREAVGTYLARANTGNAEEAERSIRLYADFVKRQYDLAVKHAQRKEQG